MAHFDIQVHLFRLLSATLLSVPRKSIVQQGGFAHFVSIEDGLYPFLGVIELGKQGLDTCDNALLFVQGWKRRNHLFQYGEVTSIALAGERDPLQEPKQEFTIDERLRFQYFDAISTLNESEVDVFDVPSMVAEDSHGQLVSVNERVVI